MIITGFACKGYATNSEIAQQHRLACKGNDHVPTDHWVCPLCKLLLQNSEEQCTECNSTDDTETTREDDTGADESQSLFLPPVAMHFIVLLLSTAMIFAIASTCR